MEINNEYMMFCPKCGTLVYPKFCRTPFCVECGTTLLQSKILKVKDYPVLSANTPMHEREEVKAQRLKFRRKQFEYETLPLGQFDMSLKSAQFEYSCIYDMPDPQPAIIERPKPDVPKCPICGSTKLKKISTANKVGSVALFGLFAAGHVSKTWKCENCGSKF